MVETEANFPQKKVERFLGYPSVGVEPVFGVAPESLDPIDMGSTSGAAGFLPDHHVLSPHCKGSVGLPIVRVVEASGLGMRLHQANQRLCLPLLNREHGNLAIALKDAQHDDLPCCSPTSFASPPPPEGRLVTFYGPIEGLSTFFFPCQYSPNQAIKPLDRSLADRGSKSQSVDRNAQDKPLQQSPLVSIGNSASIPDRDPSVLSMTSSALESSIAKMPGSGMETLGTPLHDLMILHHPGPVW